MTSLIHINDNNILVQQGSSWARSLGYAWLKDKDVFFDLSIENNAVLNCRLEPQQINSRYWQQCSQTALPANEVGMRHSADLIWKHLASIREKFQLNDVSFVVPSNYQADNLSLLLGVARAADMQVHGLINKAVYSLYSEALSQGRYMHIDVQLHQTVCSELLVEENKLSLGKVEILHEVGLHSVQDALLRAIQERFIASDRFDPLHYAETEQQLFDQLNDFSEQIDRNSKADMIIEYGGKKHGCSIDVKQWRQALSGPLQTLTELGKGVSGSTFIDFNGFRGLSSSLPEFKDISAQDLSIVPGSKFETASPSEQLMYCTSLDYLAQDSVDGSGPATEAHGAIGEVETENRLASQSFNVNANSTHLLQNGVAIPAIRARIDFKDGQIILAGSGNPNLQQMLQEGKLYNLNDSSKSTLKKNDRLASDLADGILTVIDVVEQESPS